MEDINKIIRNTVCRNCEYGGNPSNACQRNQYKECTEYGQRFFDSEFFIKKYINKDA